MKKAMKVEAENLVAVTTLTIPIIFLCTSEASFELISLEIRKK